MSKRRGMKLILLPEGSSQKREYRISRTKTVLFVILVIGFVSTITFTASRFMSSHMTRLALSDVLNENNALHQQLELISERLVEVDSQLIELSSSDDQLRLMADIPRIDPDVRRVGVGGVVIPNSDNITNDQELNQIILDLEMIERELKLQRQSFSDIEQQFVQKADLVAHIPSIRPVSGGFISSAFGYRNDPFTGRRTHHNGLDISVERGTPVYAPADGKVIFAKRAPGFGNLVTIDHGYGFRTAYGHLSKINVKKGQSVERWMKIGEVGSTGRSTGTHLHYEVHIDKKPVDPTEYIFNNLAFGSK